MIKIHDLMEDYDFGVINDYMLNSVDKDDNDLLLHIYNKIRNNKKDVLYNLLSCDYDEKKKHLLSLTIKINSKKSYTYTYEDEDVYDLSIIIETASDTGNETEYKDTVEINKRLDEIRKEYEKQEPIDYNPQTCNLKKEYRKVIQFDEKGFYQD